MAAFDKRTQSIEWISHPIHLRIQFKCLGLQASRLNQEMAKDELFR
jgi:hypothetical protein